MKSEHCHCRQNCVFDVLNAVTEALTNALRHKDPYTQLHSFRVIDLSNKLGKLCHLSPHDLELLRFSASLHDIGKIGIHDPVLIKPGPLNDKEWTEMKAHAEIGAEIVSSLDSEESPKVAEAIRHHHENYLGNGYPYQLKGEDIPYLSRIITIADCFDALTERRPYHKPATKEEALIIMREEMEEKFDPYIFNKFMILMEND